MNSGDQLARILFQPLASELSAEGERGERRQGREKIDRDEDSEKGSVGLSSKINGGGKHALRRAANTILSLHLRKPIALSPLPGVSKNLRKNL